MNPFIKKQSKGSKQFKIVTNTKSDMFFLRRRQKGKTIYFELRFHYRGIYEKDKFITANPVTAKRNRDKYLKKIGYPFPINYDPLKMKLKKQQNKKTKSPELDFIEINKTIKDLLPILKKIQKLLKNQK